MTIVPINKQEVLASPFYDHAVQMCPYYTYTPMLNSYLLLRAGSFPREPYYPV